MVKSQCFILCNCSSILSFSIFSSPKEASRKAMLILFKFNSFRRFSFHFSSVCPAFFLLSRAPWYRETIILRVTYSLVYQIVTASFAFCVITFEPIEIQTRSASQNDHLNLSFVKDKHTYGKKMARKGPTTVVCQYLSFPIRVYFIFLQWKVIHLHHQNLPGCCGQF